MTRGPKSAEVTIGPKGGSDKTPEIAPCGALVDTPRADESPKMTVWTVKVGFPSGPIIIAVVSEANVPAESSEEPGWGTPVTEGNPGLVPVGSVPVGITRVESMIVGRPSVPRTV